MDGDPGGKKFDRRTVLRGLAATLGSAAVPDTADAAQKAERSPAFKEFMSVIQNASAGLMQESQTFETGGANEALKLITDHKVDVPWNALKGTRLDPVAIESKSVMLAVIKGQMGLKISRMKTLEDMAVIADVTQGDAAYAQGVPVASGIVLTNKHVTEGLTALAGDVMFVREHPVYDLAFALIPDGNFSSKEMLKYPIPLANEDVHAGFVIFTSINPTTTAHHTGASTTGRKTFGGMAVRMPESFMRGIFKGADLTAAQLKRFRDSFLVEIPNSESLGSKGEAVPIRNVAFRGSSSSPVFVLRDGAYEFCGVIDSVMRIPMSDGTFRTFAVFHGPEAINTAAKDLGQY